MKTPPECPILSLLHHLVQFSRCLLIGSPVIKNHRTCFKQPLKHTDILSCGIVSCFTVCSFKSVENRAGETGIEQQLRVEYLTDFVTKEGFLNIQPPAELNLWHACSLSKTQPTGIPPLIFLWSGVFLNSNWFYQQFSCTSLSSTVTRPDPRQASFPWGGCNANVFFWLVCLLTCVRQSLKQQRQECKFCNYVLNQCQEYLQNVNSCAKQRQMLFHCAAWKPERAFQR